jgi:hypothetical protein
MIKELDLTHGLDVWVNKQLENEIETVFKKVLDTDVLYYYYISLKRDQKDCKMKKEVKWMGKVSLINFIKKVQKVDGHFCPIGVTNAKSKKVLLNYLEYHFHDTDVKVWDYWIGDVVRAEMVCGDDMVITLWDRIKNKVTKIDS